MSGAGDAWAILRCNCSAFKTRNTIERHCMLHKLHALSPDPRLSGCNTLQTAQSPKAPVYEQEHQLSTCISTQYSPVQDRQALAT